MISDKIIGAFGAIIVGLVIVFTIYAVVQSVPRVATHLMESPQ